MDAPAARWEGETPSPQAVPRLPEGEWFPWREGILPSLAPSGALISVCPKAPFGAGEGLPFRGVAT